jgi:hypothetical protein
LANERCRIVSFQQVAHGRKFAAGDVDKMAVANHDDRRAAGIASPYASDQRAIPRFRQ